MTITDDRQTGLCIKTRPILCTKLTKVVGINAYVNKTPKRVHMSRLMRNIWGFWYNTFGADRRRLA